MSEWKCRCGSKKPKCVTLADGRELCTECANRMIRMPRRAKPAEDQDRERRSISPVIEETRRLYLERRKKRLARAKAGAAA